MSEQSPHRKRQYLAIGLLLAGGMLLGYFIAADSIGIGPLADGRMSIPQILGALFGAALMVGGLFVWISKSGESESRFSWQNLGLLAGSLLFTFLLIEIAARLYLMNFATEAQFNRYASLLQLERRYGEDFMSELGVSRFIGHRYLGYIPNPGWSTAQDRHNERGFRGDEIAVPKPEGVFRIVCLGGSTTYGGGVVDYRLAYPYQLQEQLRAAGYEQIEVVNGGAFGWSSYESLINLETRVLEIEPDLILIYDNVNDLPIRWVNPEEYGDGRYGLNTPLNQGAEMVPLWQYSTALRTLAIMTGLIQPAASLDERFGMNFVQDTDLTEVAGALFGNPIGAQTGGVVSDEVRERRLAELEANPPIFFERNLRSMIAVAEAQGIEVVLQTFAHSDQLGDQFAEEYYEVGIAEHNELVIALGEELGVPVHDLASTMPAEARFWVDGIHASYEGEALIGEKLAQFLIEEGLIGE